MSETLIEAAPIGQLVDRRRQVWVKDVRRMSGRKMLAQ